MFSFLRDKANRKFNSTGSLDELILVAVVLFLALILGTVVRWNFIAGSDYPINDGGLFYSLISDLVNNNFKFTSAISYNQAGIPNSYPPLAFYLVGGLRAITGIPIIKLLHYLPFVISVLTIPVFYAVTRIFYEEDYFSRALATLLFATLPRSFEWFVMGGGITRSLGFIFALLALIFYVKITSDEKVGKDLLLTAIFSSLTVLSHPVAVLFLAFSILIISIYYWPINLVYPLSVAIFVILASSPWWGTVLMNNGISSFIGAANTGHLDWLDAGYILTLNFNFENRFFLPIVTFLALIGLFSEQKRKARYLGVLVGLGYLVVPRGGIDLLTSYLALLGTLGFSVLIKSWQSLDSIQLDGKKKMDGLDRRTGLLLICLTVYTFIGAYSYKYIDGKAELHLTDEDYRAMVWIRENTDRNAKVLHLPPVSDYHDWWNDYFGEWMPALTERQNVATVQGYEWLTGEFDQRIEAYIALRSCTEQGVDCVEKWVNTYDNDFDYLLLSTKDHPRIVIEEFDESARYLLVYENEDVMIVKRDGGSS